MNKGIKKGRSLPTEEVPGPAFRLGHVLLAYREEPHLLPAQRIARQVLGSSSDHRLVGDPALEVGTRVDNDLPCSRIVAHRRRKGGGGITRVELDGVRVYGTSLYRF